MGSQCIIDSYREGAEVFRGDDACKKKMAEVLKEMELPLGLLPLDDVEELGYHRETGFIWVRQKKRLEHHFKAIKRLVSYAAEVSAFVEARKLRKISGVKAREFLLWFSIVEVFIDDPSSGKITFKTGAGMSERFPISAFEPEQS